jgi:hypothetical protein
MMIDFDIDDFARAMTRSDCTLADAGRYENGYSRKGYFAKIRSGNKHLSFSVSNCDNSLAPNEVATAITHPNRHIYRQGYYRNKKGVRGFEATVRSGEHFYMLSAHNV